MSEYIIPHLCVTKESYIDLLLEETKVNESASQDVLEKSDYGKRHWSQQGDLSQEDIDHYTSYLVFDYYQYYSNSTPLT